MAKDLSVPNQGIREKHLNIVYFIDSAKSHSIRVNLVLARWIVAIVVGIALWAVISIGWIVSLDFTLKQSRDHLSEVLASLFNYQVKYEHVFEQAYPDSMTQSYYAAGSQLSSNDPTASSKVADPAKVPAAKKETIGERPTADALAAIPQSPPQTPVVSDQGVATNGSVAIELSNTVLKAANGKMVLLFDISNKDSKRKAEGYIWATGSILLADGTTKRISAPAHAKVNASGDIDAFNSTYKFSIQRFKRKDFMFAVPSDTTWKVSDLRITFVDALGKNRVSKEIATTVDFSTPDDLPQDADTNPNDAEGSIAQ